MINLYDIMFCHKALHILHIESTALRCHAEGVDRGKRCTEPPAFTFLKPEMQRKHCTFVPSSHLIDYAITST